MDCQIRKNSIVMKWTIFHFSKWRDWELQIFEFRIYYLQDSVCTRDNEVSQLVKSLIPDHQFFKWEVYNMEFQKAYLKQENEGLRRCDLQKWEILDLGLF